MAKSPKRTRAAGFVQKVADALSNTLSSDAPAGWRSAFVDFRFPPGGGSSICKGRITAKAGNVIDVEVVPIGISVLVFNMIEACPRVDGKEWFGLKVTVYPDGRHEVVYNHDPDCINDADFYEGLCDEP